MKNSRTRISPPIRSTSMVSHPLSVMLIALLAIGCNVGHAKDFQDRDLEDNVPDASEMKLILHDPDDRDSSKTYEMSEEESRIEIVSELRKLDWTQGGLDLARVRLRMPQIEIQIVDREGEMHRYQLYWEGDQLVDHDASLLRTMELEALREVIKRETEMR